MWIRPKGRTGGFQGFQKFAFVAQEKGYGENVEIAPEEELWP
jgi:hypothetical protein